MRCGKRGILGGNRKERRQESIGSVAADPEDLENSKEAGREAQDTQSLRKNLQVERVCPLFAFAERFS